MTQTAMLRTAILFLCILSMTCVLSVPAGIHAQGKGQLHPPDKNAYGLRFFDQLHGIFGIFRNDDLQRVFRMAQPIQCSELTVSDGAWKTVAYFNEDRSVGEWCYISIEEVKKDLSVYTFKGSCGRGQGDIEVTTEFPVGAGIDLYNEGKIALAEVGIKVNAPVKAIFDQGTQAYTFELPYLFLTGRRTSGNLYSMNPRQASDRYAAEVTSSWECKAVKSNDVTYRFLICRTTTWPSKMRLKDRDLLSFGASAYFIMSDGMEAQTSVRLTFSDAGRSTDTGTWQMPDVRSKVVDVAKTEFRLRFSTQMWTGKIGSPEVLAHQNMSSPSSAKLHPGADYCAWHPSAGDLVDRLVTNKPGEDVSYSADGFDRNNLAATSIVFYLKTGAGRPIGTLQCIFPRAETSAQIDFDRWLAVVGRQVALEVRK